MKNILHVINVYFSLSYFGDQFKYFGEKGYREHLICSPSEYLEGYAKKNGIKYLEVPVNRKISIIDDLKAIWRVFRYIKKNKIDVVSGHTPKGAMVGMIAAFLANVPIRLYFRHGLAYETSKGLTRFLIKNTDRITSLCATKIICASPSVLEVSLADRLAPPRKQVVLLKGTCGGIDTNKVFNPSNIDNKSLDTLRKQYKIDNDDFVVGFTGRLVKDKGIEELVNAFKQLEGKSKIKLLLVGLFEERDAISTETREYILNSENIIYTGFVNENIQLFYSLMDVYVLPSYREGFPTGVLEAQSMKTPVLTTRVTGCIDSIIDGQTGYYISHDPSDIASKIDHIRINSPINTSNCRKWVETYFRNQVIWDEIEKYYIDK